MSNIQKAKQNILIFASLTLAMVTTALFMWLTSGLSAGTYLATALTGLFTGLMLASRQRVKTLESRLAA